jgi:hypothetical protein
MILRPVSKGHPPDSHATLVLKRLWFSSACGSQAPVVLKRLWFSSACGSQGPVVLKGLWFSRACGLISVQVEFNGSLDA